MALMPRNPWRVTPSLPELDDTSAVVSTASVKARAPGRGAAIVGAMVVVTGEGRGVGDRGGI